MIKGINVDYQGRCQHWHSAVDIVANLCAKCKCFYACYECHDVMNLHKFEPMSINNEERAVMCGVCNYQMTVWSYQHSNYQCPNCHHAFNQRCSLHNNTYFC